jgi:hypothetical protein
MTEGAGADGVARTLIHILRCENLGELRRLRGP